MMILDFLLASSVLFSTISFGSTLASQIKEWQGDPKLFMNSGPMKTDAHGFPVPDADFRDLDASTLSQRSEVRRKVRDRILFKGHSNQKAAADMSTNNPEDFLQSGLKFTNIFDLDKPELKSSRSSILPWSGDYWGTYKGGIAARFSDPSFEGSSSWSENYAYVKLHPAADLIRLDSPEELVKLSPAEKYDLISDSGGKLASYAWGEGEAYLRNVGEVETWFGICHGWAPASYIEARPSAAIDVPVAGLKSRVKFLPSDIKALASQMWAKSQFSSRFIGGRCEEREVTIDENTGRIIEKDCFDINPMSWHLSIIHELGIEKRAFVVDASEDYQVWNQPVFEYKMSYFNPLTALPSEDLAASMIDYALWTNDPYKAWRNPLVKKIVGVAMDISYRTETSPSSALIDTEEQDNSYTTRYIYDLELDDKGEIIGGEWYQRRHPDFIWTAALGARPMGYGDRNLESVSWNPLTQKFPVVWKDNVARAADAGQIPDKIMESLIRASAAKVDQPLPPVPPIL